VGAAAAAAEEEAEKDGVKKRVKGETML